MHVVFADGSAVLRRSGRQALSRSVFECVLFSCAFNHCVLPYHQTSREGLSGNVASVDACRGAACSGMRCERLEEFMLRIDSTYFLDHLFSRARASGWYLGWIETSSEPQAAHSCGQSSKQHVVGRIWCEKRSSAVGQTGVRNFLIVTGERS